LEGWGGKGKLMRGTASLMMKSAKQSTKPPLLKERISSASLVVKIGDIREQDLKGKA